MPKNVIIDINDNYGQAVFNPPSQTVGVGDVIYWRNNTDRPQTLVLKSNPSVTWVPAISAKLPDQPAPTSQRGITFRAATDPNGVQYISSTNSETGTIIVQ